MSKKSKIILINMFGGLGDAITRLDLIYALKKDGYLIDGYFNQNSTLELCKSFELFENYIMTQKINFKIIGYNKYFTDFLYSKSFLFYALISFKKIYLLHKENEKPNKMKFFKNVKLLEVEYKKHMSWQNLKLFRSVNYEFFYPFKWFNYNKSFLYSNILSEKKYIVVQLSSGDLLVNYKNWDLLKWYKLLNKIKEKYSDFQFVLVGSKSEIETISNVFDQSCKFLNLVGKTNIKDLVNLIYYSRFYIGLDSGLMHISYALNIPTITLWGPTCKSSYGYSQFNTDHIDISLNLHCSPCQSPTALNTIRFNTPIDCTSRECLRDLNEDIVFNKVDIFLKNKLNK